MKYFHKMACWTASFAVLLTGPAWAAYQFSEYSFARNPARVDNQMRIQMSGRSALRSYKFVGRVGGVNFEEAVDLSDFVVELSYDHSLPDGSRASLSLDGQRYQIPLFDWELLPITNYADSEFTAVVSIFGDGPDPENYRYIDYHPAFEDTHIGMRLLQADIMLMDPIVFSEAPSDGGQKLYMAGESKEASYAEREAVAIYLSLLLGETNFQAWVLTDTDEEPEIEIFNETVEVDLDPYYYFWLGEYGTSAEAKFTLFDDLAEQILSLEQSYDSAYDSYLNAPAGSDSEASALAQFQLLEAKLDAKVSQAIRLRDELETLEPDVVEVEDLTAIMKDNYNNTRLVAPFVYDAVEKTAGYAALFRGAKSANGEEWEKFHKSVATAITLPVVETPNQFEY